MSQDPVRQLLDLAAVHGFYLAVLERVTGEDVPVPHGASAAERTGSPVEQSVSVLRRWLNILDMAISPPMIRDSLKESLEPATAEALLRYYVFKTSKTDVDRDKCDFINTFLYRNWRTQQKMSPAPRDAVEILPGHALAYEGEIFIMLGDVEPPALPEEHLQLAREFEPLRQEVDEFSHFDQVMDSGIIGRVRELKHSFGSSFYHPHVLSDLAIYNAFFGQKFDDLFLKATEDIKSFAQNITQGGGSIMTRVNDDVTVKELAEVKQDEILHEEYGKARDKLRKIAQFKKVIDNKRKGRFVGPVPTSSGSADTEKVVPIRNVAFAAAGATPSPTGIPVDQPAPGMLPQSGLAPAHKLQEHKIANISDMIRNFIAAADRAFNNVVPLRNCQVTLLPAEVEAFRNPYLEEKSFRSDYASIIRNMVALMATMQVEMGDYRGKRDSAYLWKQHADALKFFLEHAGRIGDQAKEMRTLCEQRGLVEKARILDATTDRLRKHSQEVAKVLQA